MDILKAIIAYFLSPIVIIGFLTYTARMIFEKYLDKRSEIYKKELDNQKELYKTELSKILYSYQIKLSSLYEERRKVIRDLYNKILELEKILSDAPLTIQAVVGTREKPKVVNDFYIKYRDVSESFEKEIILFEDDFCDKIKKFINLYFENITEFNRAANLQWKGEARLDEKTFEEAFALYEKVSNDVKQKMPDIKKDLINEFRKHLGVFEM